MEYLVAKDQVAHNLTHITAGHKHTAAALPEHGFIIGLKRHRRWSGVLAAIERFARVGNTRAGDRIQISAFP